MNHFGLSNKINKKILEGKTGISYLDHCIKQANEINY